MKEIPKEFKKHGFEYTLIKRIGNIALYRQYKVVPGYKVLGVKVPKGYIEAWEVHKVRKYSAGTIKFANSNNIVHREEGEKLCEDNKFGNCAWSFKNKQNAEIKFQDLVGQELEAEIKNAPIKPRSRK